eukprot:6187973-Pleurochrysis_carterae.AAC.1
MPTCCRGALQNDAVSSGLKLKFEATWARGVENPPFQADNLAAVEFLYAVLDSAVGRHIQHSFSVFEAVAVPIAQFTLNGKTSDTARSLAPHTGLSAVYIALASLYHKQRSPAPGKDDLKRLSNTLTRKEGGKGSVGRRANTSSGRLRVAVNQRRRDSDVASLSAIDAEKQLLMRWDGINFDGSIFESSLCYSKAVAKLLSVQLAVQLAPARTAVRVALFIGLAVAACQASARASPPWLEAAQ